MRQDSEQFSLAPGLSGAALCRMRRVSVDDFGQEAYACTAHSLRRCGEPCTCLRGIVRLRHHDCLIKQRHLPAPCGAIVVCWLAATVLITRIMSPIRMGWVVEKASIVRHGKMIVDWSVIQGTYCAGHHKRQSCLDYAVAHSLVRNHAQCDCQQLVWPHRIVWRSLLCRDKALRIPAIHETIAVFPHKQCIE